MDCTFTAEEGKFNYQVGLIIANGRKVLMAKNPADARDYFYSVGGRVKFGESLTDAALREAREETGITCEIERMAAVHENFFTDGNGVPYHELSVFFLVKTNDKLLSIEDGHLTDHGPDGEFLTWIDLDRCDGLMLYPAFLRTWDFAADTGVRHFVTRE